MDGTILVKIVYKHALPQVVVMYNKMGLTCKLAIISLLLNKVAAITNKVSNYPKDFVRHSAPNPPTDWEPGLREAANQALIRERIANPELRERLMNAPIIGHQNRASPFGDIAILAKGKLINTPNGLQFVQENNDCIECNICDEACKNNKNIMALWMVKRVRHRDENYGHRYELEYVISPTNSVKRNPRFDNSYGIPGHVFVVKTNPTGATQNFFKIYSQDKHNYVTNARKTWYSPQDLNLGFPPIQYEQQAAPPLEDFKDIKPVTEATHLHQLQKPDDGFYQPNYKYLPAQPQFHNFIPPTEEIQDHHDTEIDLYKNLVHTLAQKTSTYKYHPTKETPFKFNENTPSKTTRPTNFGGHITTNYVPTNTKQTDFEHVNYITKPTKFSGDTKTTVFVPDYYKTTHQTKTSIFVPNDEDEGGNTVSTQAVIKDYTQEYHQHSTRPGTIFHYTPTMSDLTQFPQQTDYTQNPSTKSQYHTTNTFSPTQITKEPTHYNTYPETSNGPTISTHDSTYTHLPSIKPTYLTTSDNQKTTEEISKPPPTFYIDYDHEGYPKTTPTTSFTDHYNQHHHTQTGVTNHQDNTTPTDYKIQTTPNFIEVPIKTHTPKKPNKKDDNLDELFPRKNYPNSINEQLPPTKETAPTKATDDFLFHDIVQTTRKTNKNKKVDDADIFGKDVTTRKSTPKDEFELITPVVVKTTKSSKNDSLETLETKNPDATTEGSKIIYSDFYIASTAHPTTNLDGFTETTTTPTTESMKTTPKRTKKISTRKRNIKYTKLSDDTVGSTTQSYSTSITFEVNKKNGDDLIESKTSRTLENIGFDKGKYNDIALSLINNAKSIDYLENQTKRPKYRRKIYTRTKKLRKKITDE